MNPLALLTKSPVSVTFEKRVIYCTCADRSDEALARAHGVDSQGLVLPHPDGIMGPVDVFGYWHRNPIRRAQYAVSRLRQLRQEGRR